MLQRAEILTSDGWGRLSTHCIRCPEERALGIDAGLAWAAHCDLVAVYTDLGISPGMRHGIDAHTARGTPIVYRSIAWAE